MLVDSLIGAAYAVSSCSHANIWSVSGCADLDSGFACVLTLSVATAIYSERTPSEQLNPKTLDGSNLACTFGCVGGMMIMTAKRPVMGTAATFLLWRHRPATFSHHRKRSKQGNFFQPTLGISTHTPTARRVRRRPGSCASILRDFHQGAEARDDGMYADLVTVNLHILEGVMIDGRTRNIPYDALSYSWSCGDATLVQYDHL